MCGISGVLVSPSDLARVQVDEVVALLTREMESRGKEATGIARLTVSNRIRLTKAPVVASTFLAKHPGIGAGCRLVISHTRQSTQGSPKDNINNHPIVCGDIIGVHNGMVHNDYELYRTYGWNRAGKVDSEAIFAAINHLGAVEGLEELEGSIACAWMDKTDLGALWIARHTHSPMHVGISEGGSVIFASTNAAVAKAAVLFPGGITIDPIKEGVILRCVHDEDGALDVQTTEFSAPARSFVRTYGSGWEVGGTQHGANGFQRGTRSVPNTPTSATVTNIGTSRSATDPSWAVGGNGYVIKPNDPVVFVPLDEEFDDVVGTFVDTSYKSGYAYLRVHLDFGVTDEISVPIKQLFPIAVWRETPTKIPRKGAFQAQPIPLTTGLPAAEEEVEDAMLQVINTLNDDQTPRAETFWNLIMQAEADDNEALANALVLAYDAGMEIESWVNAEGDVEAPDSLKEAIFATVDGSREMLALGRSSEVAWDDVIDVEEVFP